MCPLDLNKFCAEPCKCHGLIYGMEMNTHNPRNLKIFCAAWPLHHSGVFTSICCFAQGTMQKNLSASPWLPIKPNRGLWKYHRKERLSGIGWKCVQIEASLPNLLKCKIKGPGSEA